MFAAEAPDRRGEEVVVIYNKAGGADSIFVAQHYGMMRNVPDRQLIGLSLPRKETMTRAEFDRQLREPLVRELVERELVQFHGEIVPAQEGRPGRVVKRVLDARIRYLVLCYGVPLRIARDDNLASPGQENLPQQMQRNEAAVDSELAYLAQIEGGLPVAGPNRNPQHGATDASLLHPRHGVFMVARLDGPTADIATRLVDKAVQAERDGLWGRAWFDLRGINSGGYKVGDDWIRAASQVAKRTGFETVVDEAGEVFPDGFPMPQVALYAGWYAGSATGPFRADDVEFMPGSIAYHLHSFSARTVRNRTAAWVGPFLDRGVTATFGCVYEPYLGATANVGVLYERLFESGFTFGEAIYAAQNTLSWQTTVVGDPLYRPTLRSFDEHKARLAGSQVEAEEWVIVQDLNRRLTDGLDPKSAGAELERQPLAKRSAILQQKLSELHVGLGQQAEAIIACQLALDGRPSPEQEAHLQLALARLYTAADRKKEAVKAYEQFFEEHPKRPGLLAIYQEALPVAQAAGRDRSAEAFAREIERLTPPPPEPKEEPADG